VKPQKNSESYGTFKVFLAQLWKNKKQQHVDATQKSMASWPKKFTAEKFQPAWQRRALYRGVINYNDLSS
jgi:hypothetical protein